MGRCHQGGVTCQRLPGTRSHLQVQSLIWGGPGGGGDTARPIKISVLSRPIRTPALTAHSRSRAQPAGDKTVPSLQQAHKQGHCHGLRRGHCWAAIAVVEEAGGRRSRRAPQSAFLAGGGFGGALKMRVPRLSTRPSVCSVSFSRQSCSAPPAAVATYNDRNPDFALAAKS